MRTAVLSAIAFGALLGVVSGAWADATIYGEGNESCGDWTANRHAGGNTMEAIAAEAWVRGSISQGEAIAWALHLEAAPNTDAQAMNGWMDNYCTAHPLDTIAKAVIDLRLALLKQRPSDASAGAQPPDEGVNTNKELLALCRDPVEAITCLSYLRGYLDGFLWTAPKTHVCPDPDMKPERIRDLYFQLFDRWTTPSDLQQGLAGPAAAALSAVMQAHSHACS